VGKPGGYGWGAQRRHDTLIDACNILWRAMAKSEKAMNWRQTMGDDREDIGDFACQLHCILGIRAR